MEPKRWLVVPRVIKNYGLEKILESCITVTHLAIETDAVSSHLALYSAFSMLVIGSRV